MSAISTTTSWNDYDDDDDDDDDDYDDDDEDDSERQREHTTGIKTAVKTKRNSGNATGFGYVTLRYASKNFHGFPASLESNFSV